VSIWKNAGGYRSSVDGQEIQPITWLIAIVRNKALDALRARKRRNTHEQPLATGLDGDAETEADTAADPAPGAVQLFDQAMRALRIDGCMSALDGSFRQSLASGCRKAMWACSPTPRAGGDCWSVRCGMAARSR
jgi:RNA polymerase sigma-70 factor (ECF subfamily)